MSESPDVSGEERLDGNEELARRRRSETARVLYQRYRAVSGDAAYAASRLRRSRGIGDFDRPRSTPNSTDLAEGAKRNPGDAFTPPSPDSARAPQSAPWDPPVGIYRSKTGARRSRWDPQPLGTVLSGESRRRGWEQTLSVASVTGQWEQIVGPHIAQHCPIESFEGGTLIARADSTAWAQQLQVLLTHIHKRIDERVGPGVVDKVIVRPPSAPSWTKGKRVYKGGRGPRDTYG